MSKPFTLTQLRYFAVVAELKNMTAMPILSTYPPGAWEPRWWVI
ncbi:MAG TPA: hypothetical protein VGN49_02220 [Micrococcaceae bacterium]|jgi:hypothetical protein|nr:hypothetical protein [Micrococcaceae bacterium]